VVQNECTKLGLTLPRTHEHAYNREILQKEEAEFHQANYLLCPSDFVARTFRERGFVSTKLARHQYGFDEKQYYCGLQTRKPRVGLSVLFVGGCAPRKGVHYALDAWLQSSARHDGIFQIAGEFVPGYAEILASMLSHSSVRVLGHRHDVPELMRQADILILPSIEEGSALVTAEARGSGCVLVVSEAAGAICEHMKDALVHPVGDVKTLAEHLTLLHENRRLLNELRDHSLATVSEITWTAAGVRLLAVYREILGAKAAHTTENRLLPV
jgi:glycosyltransferase involved in cell wall biosynthesis